MKLLPNTTSAAKALCFAVCDLVLTGCGGRYDSTVNGTVTLDGNPVPRGAVSFSPQGSGATAYGLIKENGGYTLQTGREAGLPPGQYVATVAANEESAARGKDGGPPPLGKPITPDWYRSPSTSGLTFEVKPGDNKINLELKTSPPPGYKPPKRRT